MSFRIGPRNCSQNRAAVRRLLAGALAAWLVGLPPANFARTIATEVESTGERLAVPPLTSSSTETAAADGELDASLSAGKPAKVNDQPPLAAPRYRTRKIRGRVAYLGESLVNLNIGLVPEASERLLLLRTDDGSYLPIVEDKRGRSFRKDKRLREMHVELLVRDYDDLLPMVQVIKIFELSAKEKYLIDYWCDVCAITMFEDGPCDCCQDHNRLRKRAAGLADELLVP